MPTDIISTSSPVAFGLVVIIVGAVSALGGRWWALSSRVSAALTREQAADMYLKQAEYHRDRADDVVQRERVLVGVKDLQVTVSELKLLLVSHCAADDARRAM